MIFFLPKNREFIYEKENLNIILSNKRIKK